MSTQHEAPKQKHIPEYHFQPNRWIEPSDREFLEEFSRFLEAKGLDPYQLVYSGFDASPLREGKPLPRKVGIFAMNYPGWERTLNQPGKNNPAMYAENHKVPCIGLYDRNQLAEAFMHDHPHRDPVGEDYEELDHSLEFLRPVISVEQIYDPASLDELTVGGQRYEVPGDPAFRDDDFEIRDSDTSADSPIKGDNLSDLPVDHLVEEGVIHRNYPEDPNARPADALVGLVFLDPFQPEAARARNRAGLR